MRPVDWRELRKVCLLLGCVDARERGDHFLMTRPGLARPVVFKKVKDLREDIVLGVARTLGIGKKELENLLAQVGGKKRRRAGRG